MVEPIAITERSEIPGLPREAGDGRRDVYALDHERLILHLDRVGARGAALPTPIPGSGRVVSQLSTFWFDQTHNVAPSHFLTDDPDAIRRRLLALGTSCDTRSLAGRAQLVNRTRSLPVRCDVIGALYDDDWEDYRTRGGFANCVLPSGLTEGDRLREPLFLARGTDEAPLSEHGLSHLLEPGHARQLEAHSLGLYAAAAEVAEETAGLYLTRARFEFGLLDATVVLIGCPLTPETASFREALPDEPAGARPDVARGPLEEFLRRIHWHGGEHLPELPPDVVARTATGYRTLFERLTGRELE